MHKGMLTGFMLLAAVAAGQDDTVIEGGTPASPAPVQGSPEGFAPLPEDSYSPEAQPDPTPQEQRSARRKAASAKDAHIVSHSRLFSVSGGEALRMGAIATKADETYRQVCSLLELDEEWKYGISIRLLGQADDPPVPNPVRTRIAIIGGEPNFQIRIYPGGGIDLDRLTHAIITMVLYERSLRGMNPNAYPDTMSLPPWLVTGVQQAILWKRGRADRRLYRNLFNRAEMLSPEEIIGTADPQKLDASTRQVYEVSCGVLLMSLINQSGGQASLRGLVADAATLEGSPREIIARYFHELSLDENALEKWWAMELAALSADRVSEALTPLETERRLAEALTVMCFDEETQLPRPVSVDDAYTLTSLPGWRELLGSNVEQLVQLSHYCFPGYRFIITEYCRAIAELVNGASPDEVQNILGPLHELRREYLSTAIRGRDYLDWYEITHLGSGRQGSFEAYLDAMSLLRRRQQGRPTPISRYLDDIEALHTLGEDEPLPKGLQAPSRHAAPQETE